VDRSAGVLWIVSGDLFLGSSGICPNLSAPHERLPCTGTSRRKLMLGNSDEELVAVAECDFKSLAQLPMDHFNKLLEVTCPN
jgi:hypothetical protein